MANSKLQLAAIGHQDRRLTGNPQISYFKSVYKRHTNFMMQKKKVEFNTDVVFDNTNKNELSNVLKSLMSNHEMREKFKQNALKYSRNNTIQITAEKIIETLQ